MKKLILEILFRKELKAIYRYRYDLIPTVKEIPQDSYLLGYNMGKRSAIDYVLCKLLGGEK